jgi:phospholipid/cholesterol/gamma-HCH transport system substrate-binding protein
MRKSQVQQMSMEIAVGAFIVFMMVSLGFVTIILGKGVFAHKFSQQVRFPDVTGLIKGDKVYLHGVDVGRVRGMTATRDGVVLDLVLFQEIEFHEGYKVAVLPSSVLGGRFVDILPGDETRPAIPAGTELEGARPVDFIAEASGAVKAIREALEEGGVLANLTNTMANLSRVSDDIAAGRGTVGKLLKDEDLYASIREVVTNLASVSTRLEKGEGTIGQLLVKDEVYQNLKEVSADLRGISERLAAGKSTIGHLLSEDEALYANLTNTVASFKDTAASLKDLSESLDRGEGTLGKLMKDDQVYKDLSALLTEYRAAVDDQRETAPVVTLTNLLFGAF